MGKDLKGKELGVGIVQQADGLYAARFTDQHGRRKSKRFTRLQECRQWIADLYRYQETIGTVIGTPEKRQRPEMA